MTRVTPAALRHLAGLTELEVLDLAGLGVTDESLAHLRGLVRLKTLRLRRGQITGAGLVHLTGMSRLEDLGKLQPEGHVEEHYLELTGQRRAVRWTTWSYGPDLKDDHGTTLYDATNGTISGGDQMTFGP